MLRAIRRNRRSRRNDNGDQAWTAGSHGFRREESGVEIAQRYFGREPRNQRRYCQFRYFGPVGCATAGLRKRPLEPAISARYPHRDPLDLGFQETVALTMPGA